MSVQPHHRLVIQMQLVAILKEAMLAIASHRTSMLITQMNAFVSLSLMHASITSFSCIKYDILLLK